MSKTNKVDLATQLGSALVKIGHRDLVGAVRRLRGVSAALEVYAVSEARAGVAANLPSLPDVPNLTSIISGAIVCIAKNNLYGARQRVEAALAMVERLSDSRRKRRVDVVGRD